MAYQNFPHLSARDIMYHLHAFTHIEIFGQPGQESARLCISVLHKKYFT